MDVDKLKLLIKRKPVQTGLIILGVIIIATIIFWGKSYIMPNLMDKYVKTRTEFIEQKYIPEIEKKDAEIKVLKEKLIKSQKKYDNLTNLIKQKTEEAKKIELPKNEKELRTRFNNLGYKPLD